MPRVSPKMVDSLDLKLPKEEVEKDEKSGFYWESFINNHKLSVGLGLVGTFLLGIGILSAVVVSTKKSEPSIEIISASSEPSTTMFVHISGAVEKPGLYQLAADARVNDALIAAGGLSVQADREWFEKTVNLAQKLSDGIKIYIPFINETGKGGEVAGSQTSIFAAENQGKVNINSATVSQLETLSGIGPALAQRIVDYRNTHGPFSQIEDIMKVAGIGEKTFAKFKEQITVF